MMILGTKVVFVLWSILAICSGASLGTLRDRELQRLIALARCTTGAAGAVLAVSSSSTAVSARTVPTVCVDDSISVLRGPLGQQVTIIGTAHISEASVDQVRRIIRSQKPDTVMVELDSKRIGRAQSGQSLEDFGFVLPRGIAPAGSGSSVSFPSNVAVRDQPAPAPLKPVQVAVTGSTNFFTTVSNQAASAVLGNALKGFYGQTEKLGFSPGGEFKAAVEEGRQLGSAILLGDRDVDVTLSRLVSALSSTSAEQLSSLSRALERMEEERGFDALGASTASVGTSSTLEGLTKSDITEMMERLKTRSSISQLTSIMRDNVPALYGALIGERDIYMADAIADRVTLDGSRSLVAVCGFAHTIGIESRLESRKFSLQKRNC